MEEEVGVGEVEEVGGEDEVVEGEGEGIEEVEEE